MPAKVRFTIWLDEELATWIDKKATEERRSRNNLLVKLLQDYRKAESSPESLDLDTLAIHRRA